MRLFSYTASALCVVVGRPAWPSAARDGCYTRYTLRGKALGPVGPLLEPDVKSAMPEDDERVSLS